MSRLRANQRAFKEGIYHQWRNGHRCIVGVMATGGGKTVVMADMARELQGRGVIEAHRSELVGQISTSLAKEGIRHNITASKKTIRGIVDSQMSKFGRSFYDHRARWTVASVDTIIRRTDENAHDVQWLFQDEGHHTLAENKWGRAASAYTNARILLMTATPTRGDRKGLGRHSDGIADAMVVGPQYRELIDTGFLTDYKVYEARASDLNMTGVDVGPSGEYNQSQAAAAIHRSKVIVGDVVAHYKLHAMGKRGITFAVDIKAAQDICDEFNRQGVPAAMVHADSDPDTRREAIEMLADRRLLQLVNVDLFGEGFDLPAIECVSFARPTASFSLYAQMWGRVSRLLISEILQGAWDTYTVAQRLQFIAESEKPFGIIFDHVGNLRTEYTIGEYKYTGPPDGFDKWSLEGGARSRRSAADDGIPLRKCKNPTCQKDYERILDKCPHCQTDAPAPLDRSGPKFVDGNLYELDAAVLAQMRSEIRRVDGRLYVPEGLHGPAVVSLTRKHADRQREQHMLRESIATWAGRYMRDSDAINCKRFFFTFGVDVVSALAFGAREAETLRTRIDVNNATGAR